MAIRLERVRKRYRTPAGVVQDVLRIDDLTIPDKAQWAITGRSGSGKSTLLNLVAGILLPDEGTVRIGDVVVNELPEARRDRFRAAHIGYIFQTFNLLQGFTALENVLLGMLFAGKVDREKAVHLLGRVDLADRMEYRPSELSVGQQQRVAIARALANEPAVLLADEPTGNVDPATGDTIVDLLQGICREGGQTLLLVTHQPQVVARFPEAVDLSRLQSHA